MPTCPICSCQEFTEYRGRQLARCSGCGAKERARLMALVLHRILPLAKGRVLHLAPEESVSRFIYSLVGSRYVPADIDPLLYPHSPVPVSAIDLSLTKLNRSHGSYGAIIHSHVIEHVQSPLAAVIKNLHEMLDPGGLHIFQVPIEPGIYREDENFSMSSKRRARLFNQHDHVRMFGQDDMDRLLLPLFEGFESIGLESLAGRDELENAGVPLRSLYEWTGHTVIAYRRKRSTFSKIWKLLPIINRRPSEPEEKPSPTVP